MVCPGPSPDSQLLCPPVLAFGFPGMSSQGLTQRKPFMGYMQFGQGRMSAQTQGRDESC